MPRFRLSRRAARDLIRIVSTGARDFGTATATAYHADLVQALDMLSQFPKAGRLRTSLKRRPRVHPHGEHVIIYLEDSDGVYVLRIRHGRENWMED